MKKITMNDYTVRGNANNGDTLSILGFGCMCLPVKVDGQSMRNVLHGFYK